jgi:hypothetical protein
MITPVVTELKRVSPYGVRIVASGVQTAPLTSVANAARG